MKTRLIILLLSAATTGLLGLTGIAKTPNKRSADQVEKIEMHLSAFGVESDDFPNIDAVIDLQTDSGYCHKWYYHPKHKDSTWQLTSTEIKKIATLFENTDLSQLKTDYKTLQTDQPTSTTLLSTKLRIIAINDYGLLAEEPIKSLYKLVYKY